MKALKKISQHTFDEVVQENVDEFEMSIEDAIEDARQQFLAQNVNLDGIVTTLEGFSVARDAKEQVRALDKLFECGSGSDIVVHITNLAQRCSSDASFAKIAAQSGAVGAAARLVDHEGFPQRDVSLSSLQLLLAMLKHNCADVRELFPRQAFSVICRYLGKSVSDRTVQSTAMTMLAYAMAKHEANKDSLHEHGFSDVLIRCLRENSDDWTTVSATCKAITRYCSDDDRRPGVHPNTFVRSRELISENCETLDSLLSSLQGMQTGGLELSVQLQVTSGLCNALKVLSVNDNACSRMAEKGFSLFLDLLKQHREAPSVVRPVCALLKVVSRNDDVKRSICSSEMLPAILELLHLHVGVEQLVEQGLAVLSSVTLRQPEHCMKVADLNGIVLITEAMRRHPSADKLQRQAISTLRNLVSSHQTRDLSELILEHDAEALIRSAQTSHSCCSDVGYAALRDLGRPYVATWHSVEGSSAE